MKIIATGEAFLNPEVALESYGSGMPSLFLFAGLALAACLLFGGFFFYVSKRLFPQGKNPLKVKDCGISGLELCLLILFHLGVGLFAASMGNAFIGGEARGSSALLNHRYMTVSQGILACTPLLFLLFLMIIQGKGFQAQRFSPRRPAQRASTLLILFLCWVPLALSLSWLSHIFLAFSTIQSVQQKVLTTLLQDSSWRLPALLVSAVIAAPLTEEFIFRAGVQGWLRRYVPFLPAALVSSAAFLLLHTPWDYPQIIFTVGGLSLVLAWLYERSDNIWYPIILHALHNGVTLVFAEIFRT